LKEICGNKGQVEKLQQWLHDWFVLVYPVKHLFIANLLVQAFEFEIRFQETWQKRNEHISCCYDHRLAWNWEDH
jgi:hypothetical protein